MDIITAHRHGLIEQLDLEVEGLSGRPRDHGQRAVVLHHLYDHSRGAHGWALAEARQGLRIAQRLARLSSWLDRWGWTLRHPDLARNAVGKLADALNDASRARMSCAYRSYRLSATQALRCEAEETVPPSLLAALDQGHQFRRGAASVSDVGEALWGESEQAAVGAVNQHEIDEAWAAIDASGISRRAKRLLGPQALERARKADLRRGWADVERKLLADRTLPAAFRANPAQHFYSLHHALTERRRQAWRDACDQEQDAVLMAA